MAYPPDERHAGARHHGRASPCAAEWPALPKIWGWLATPSIGFPAESDKRSPAISHPTCRRDFRRCDSFRAPLWLFNFRPKRDFVSMTLVSIPANPVPANAFAGTLRTRDGVASALCTLRAAAGSQRNGLHLSRPFGIHRKIFRDGGRSAKARLCRRHSRLARAGAVGSRVAQSRQRTRQALLRVRYGSQGVHGGDRVARLSAAVFCAWSFDGRRHSAARARARRTLVRSRRAVRTDDRLARSRREGRDPLDDTDHALGRILERVSCPAAATTSSAPDRSPGIF